jgi:AcrR family transcriptional regulator
MKTATQRGPGRPASKAIRIRREEEILDAAAKLFAEHGYADASTQTLADALEVGKGTIYRYFPSKKALFLAAIDRLMHQLYVAIDACVARVGDPVDRIAQGVEAYLTFFAEHPEFAELLIQERAQFKDRSQPLFSSHRAVRVERWKDLYRGLIAAGRVRDVPVERIVDVISDLLYGTMFTNFFARRQRSPHEQARDIVDIALRGILSDEERTRPVETGTQLHEVQR